METPKNTNKEIKLPFLRQNSEHRLISNTKLEALKRDTSSQNIINPSLKNIFKQKNADQSNIQTKTLLKSGGCFSRPSLSNKFEGKETTDCLKPSKILKKTNDLSHHLKENFNTQPRWKDLGKDRLCQTAIDPQISDKKVQTIQNNDEQELRRSLSQFYQSYLSTGVTLKAIDLQQD